MTELTNSDRLPTAGFFARANAGPASANRLPQLRMQKQPQQISTTSSRISTIRWTKPRVACEKGFWGDFSGNFSGLGKRIGEMSTMHMATNGAIAVANLAMNIHSLHSFRSQLAQFEAIYQGLTGKECSMWTALMGDVPQVLKKAQKELLYGGLREAGMNGLITGADTALFFMKHGYMPMMAVQMVGAQMRDGMACEVPLVQVEQAMTDAQKKGMKLAPAHYAQLLQLAAPDTIGHVKSTNSMFVKLCNKLAGEQWTALKVLQAVNDNSINKIAADIQQELAAQGRKPGDTIPEQPTVQQQAQMSKPVDNAPAPVSAPAASATKTVMPTVPMTQIQSLNAVHIPPAARAAAIV
ncbi:MAG: hypothetical protein U1E36_03930 [Rickettsiales bacterium]